MAGGINKVIILGRLGGDPEIRYMPNGKAVANLSAATSESWKDDRGQVQERTEWHRLVAYGKLAEICGEYLRKGSQAYFEGKLRTRKWQNQQGQDQYTTEIVFDSLEMLGGNNEKRNAGTSKYPPKQNNNHLNPDGSAKTPQQMKNNNADPNPEHSMIDDDIPFAPIALQYRSLLNCI